MAKSTGAVKHTHKYFKRQDGRWACAGKEGCTHFLPRNMAPLPAGMDSDCWACNKPFMLTPVNMEDDKPKCDACVEQLESIGKFLESKMGPEMDPVERALRNARLMAQMKAQDAGLPIDEVEVIEPNDGDKENG